VYLEPRELVQWLQTSFSSLEGANSAPQNSLAGYKGPLRGERKREKNGREGKKRKKGTRYNDPLP